MARLFSVGGLLISPFTRHWRPFSKRSLRKRGREALWPPKDPRGETFCRGRIGNTAPLMMHQGVCPRMKRQHNVRRWSQPIKPARRPTRRLQRPSEQKSQARKTIIQATLFPLLQPYLHPVWKFRRDPSLQSYQWLCRERPFDGRSCSLVAVLLSVKIGQSSVQAKVPAVDTTTTFSQFIMDANTKWQVSM